MFEDEPLFVTCGEDLAYVELTVVESDEIAGFWELVEE